MAKGFILLKRKGRAGKRRAGCGSQRGSNVIKSAVVPAAASISAGTGFMPAAGADLLSAPRGLL